MPFFLKKALQHQRDCLLLLISLGSNKLLFGLKARGHRFQLSTQTEPNIKEFLELTKF